MSGLAADGLPPLREVIARHGLTAKKALGQNFLLDLNLTARIARVAGPLAGVTVVEGGPGPGGLARALFAAGAGRGHGAVLRARVPGSGGRRLAPRAAHVASGQWQPAHAAAKATGPRSTGTEDTGAPPPSPKASRPDVPKTTKTTTGVDRRPRPMSSSFIPISRCVPPGPTERIRPRVPADS